MSGQRPAVTATYHVIGADGAVSSVEDWPAERRRAFARLVRAWHDLADAGADCTGAPASLERFLCDDGSPAAEIERVNLLRSQLGLADV